jgi:hypothetical protein
MLPSEILNEFIRSGATVRPTSTGTVSVRQANSVAKLVLEAAKEQREQLRREVLERWCSQCETIVPRTTPGYWSPARFCPSCCEWLAHRFDREGWPTWHASMIEPAR